MQPHVIHSGTRRALVLSLALHVTLGAVGWLVLERRDPTRTELVDIELAPPPPEVEALPAEVARPPEQDTAAQPDDTTAANTAPGPGELLVDAGVDAPPDAPPDAPVDAPPDAPTDAPKQKRPAAAVDAAAVDAGEPLIAVLDDGGVVAIEGDGGTGDAMLVAVEPGAGSGSAGSGAGAGDSSGSGGLAHEAGSGSGVPGATNEPAVDGAPTTAGTAANLLAYFPKGHTVTALIRFDRLRGTEWAAQTERLLRPMPDYVVLFGTADAGIANKLDTLVISSPRPRDAAATTLVAHTRLGRSELRDFLGAAATVSWSAAKGGLLGRRAPSRIPDDKRVFLSPFKGWFLLAQPGDLGGLMTAARGDLDAVEATGKLPPWLAGIRKIEAESGDPRGPALVLTLRLGGERVELGDNDFGLGVKSFATPDRVSLAMELVKQGWLVRGNMRFTSDAAAAEFVTAGEAAKQRIADSRTLQLAIGKAPARVIANLAFRRTGPRVSYTTSVSIADARLILQVAAQQLDTYFGPAP